MSATEAIVLADKLGAALKLLEGAAPYEAVPVDLRRGDIDVLLQGIALVVALRDAVKRPAQMTLTRTGLAIAAIILGVSTAVWGALQLAAHTDEQRRASQQRCIERGGKVTVYAGGFTNWAREGMTKF